MTHGENEEKACPFVARFCLRQGCMAWDDTGGCKLIPSTKEAASLFDARLRQAVPLICGSLLDLVRVMEERARECDACSDLWDYAQEVRRSFLDELIEAQLKAGVKGEEVSVGRG
jgi:hypothetical protein